ncbi:unnamed protein product, partial [Rotaria sp. Silwood1]
FNENDLLFNLSEFILSNDQQWNNWYLNPQLNTFPNPNDKQYSQLDKLLIIRLLRPDYLINALHEYVIEQFDLNNLQIDELDLKGIHIINLPSIPVKSIKSGEFLISNIDFENNIENILKEKGKKIHIIDCQLTNTYDYTNNDYDILFFKNVHDKSFSHTIKQIRRQCQCDIILTKEANININCVDAHIHHYDCLIEGKVNLSNILYRYSNNLIRFIIGEILSNSSSILNRCEKDDIPIIYGTILIQSILVYYQYIFKQSSFTIEWTKNLIEFIYNLIQYSKDNKYRRYLIEMAFPTNSPLLRQLLNELFQQIQSKTSIELNKSLFEIPFNENQFNLQWFLSKHQQINLIYNDYPSKLNLLQHQFNIFTDKLNKLWHEKPLNIHQQLNVSLIHDNIHLFKERLPPLLKLPSNIDFKEDLVNIDNHRIKSISGIINNCPPMEIYAIESSTDINGCPVYATASSRLDPPLFYLLSNEQIDSMTYIVFQNEKEETIEIPYPNVIRQEIENPPSNKYENNPGRDSSPTSQLSQSTQRTNTPSLKDIQRDEPML